MTEQLELVLRKYDLELTPDEQVIIWDAVGFYAAMLAIEFEEEELIDEIEDHVDSIITKESKTKTITYNEDELWIIYNALEAKEELYEIDFQIMNKIRESRGESVWRIG